MPDPREGESRSDFVSRCIPVVLEDGTAKDRDQAVAVCGSMWEAKMSKDKGFDMGDLLIYSGGAIKALGDGKLGGHLVLFGDPDNLDLEGEYFTPETDFDLDDRKTSSVYFNHGFDPTLKRRRLGRGQMEKQDVGVWIEAQLEMRDEYEQAIYDLAETGKLGWSSGTAPNLIERVPADDGKSVWIKAWPLGLDASLTPIPAEPRTKAIPLKSYTRGSDLAELLMQAQAVNLAQWGPKHWAEALSVFMEVWQESGK